MIVSDRYRYVFVEQPLTASTAIAAELLRHYDGRETLAKHTNYADFYRQASDEEREYKVVIGVRHPLDQVVSGYQKLRNNHSGMYDNPELFEENGGWISKHRRRMFRFVHEEGHEFEDYFLEFFDSRIVRTSQYLWSPRSYDFTIEFESIQSEFSRFLTFVGAEQVRELPVVNKTAKRREFDTYYTPSTHATALRVFGPLVKAWGYSFPEGWTIRAIPRLSRAQFALVNGVARFAVNVLGMTPARYRRVRAGTNRRGQDI